MDREGTQRAMHRGKHRDRQKRSPNAKGGVSDKQKHEGRTDIGAKLTAQKRARLNKKIVDKLQGKENAGHRQDIRGLGDKKTNKAAASYNTVTEQKKSALNATASAADRAALKLTVKEASIR